MDDSLTQSGFARPGQIARRFDRLVVVHERDGARPRTVPLGEGLLLGREGHVEPAGALADASVSRRHARVDKEGDGWVLTDLGSRNGTKVGGRPAEGARRLIDGDALRLGDAFLVFRSSEVGALDLLEPSHPTLLGVSLEVQCLRGQIRTAAAAGLPVLVLGETGVGKELVGRALHEASEARGPLVAVNCGALPAQLVETELFGHVAGAFTGAQGASRGLFGEADGGTLFLDEIGELPLDLQPKLLRAIAEGEVRPVGASKSKTVDVRVVAATHVELEAAVRAGRFRQDLLARLRAWVITVPALRARREDVLPLFHHFVHGSAPSLVDPDAVEALLTYAWPANVRELEQAARVASHLAGRGVLGVEHLPPHLATRSDPLAAPRPATPSSAGPPEAGALRETLGEERGNVARVATRFGVDRRTVYRWMQEHGVDPSDYRGVSREQLEAALRKTGGNVGAAARELGIDRKTVYRLADRLGTDLGAFRG